MKTVRIYISSSSLETSFCKSCASEQNFALYPEPANDVKRDVLKFLLMPLILESKLLYVQRIFFQKGLEHKTYLIHNSLQKFSNACEERRTLSNSLYSSKLSYSETGS